eukprot:2304188-Amphidinium_carterae.1
MRVQNVHPRDPVCTKLNKGPLLIHIALSTTAHKTNSWAMVLAGMLWRRSGTDVWGHVSKSEPKTVPPPPPQKFPRQKKIKELK